MLNCFDLCQNINFPTNISCSVKVTMGTLGSRLMCIQQAHEKYTLTQYDELLSQLEFNLRLSV